MPKDFSSGFEHEALEADMKRLAVEVRGHRDRPEGRGLAGHELVKRSIGSLTGTVPPPPPVPPAGGGKGPLPSYADVASPETKLEIERLLDLAFHKGILEADAEAKRSSPFVVDAFHDALAGRLYPELKKRGIVD